MSNTMEDKIKKYVCENSLHRMTNPQRQLIDRTLFIRESHMEKRTCFPEQVQLISFLVKLTGVRRCVEIGCWTGVNTLMLGMATPHDGHVIAIEEYEGKHLDEAKEKWKEAGIESKITVCIGDVTTVLDKAGTTGELDRIDMMLIDGDHKHVEHHFERAIRIVKPRGLIIITRSFWNGKVLDEHCNEEEPKIIRGFNKRVRDDKRVEVCMLSIGDGLMLCMKRD